MTNFIGVFENKTNGLDKVVAIAKSQPISIEEITFMEQIADEEIYAKFSYGNFNPGFVPILGSIRIFTADGIYYEHPGFLNKNNLIMYKTLTDDTGLYVIDENYFFNTYKQLEVK